MTLSTIELLFTYAYMTLSKIELLFTHASRSFRKSDSSYYINWDVFLSKDCHVSLTSCPNKYKSGFTVINRKYSITVLF